MAKLTKILSETKWGKHNIELGKVYSNPYVSAFKPLKEEEDHEVSMGQNQLDTIIKMATELKEKLGSSEKDIPAWIQDHISKAESYITQASTNYHEYKEGKK